MAIVIYFCVLDVMLIAFLKFFHVFIALSLLGMAVYCLGSIGSQKTSLTRLNKTLLYLGAIGLITGTLLVHPKHFTFHTHWILAAYLLVSIILISLIYLNYLLKKKTLANYSRILRFFYIMLIALLVVIIHDAVTKTTFF